MIVSDRQRHCDLAFGLLAELTAILMRHPHRVLTLFGEARVINDPDFDRSMALDLGQHHLARLGQHRLV